MSAPNELNLDDSVLEFVGILVTARPIYGWGWTEGNDDRTNSVPVEEPTSSFQVRIAEFFVWNQVRRGAIAQVEQPGHIYDGCWLLFYTRGIDWSDFVHRIADYNFHIGRDRPTLYPPTHNPGMAKGSPLPRFGTCSSIWGFGQIAASQEHIDIYEQERRKEWERAKGIKPHGSPPI